MDQKQRDKHRKSVDEMLSATSHLPSFADNRTIVRMFDHLMTRIEELESQVDKLLQVTGLVIKQEDNQTTINMHWEE